MVESPGGHALKHTAEIRVQLKPGRERYTVKVDGDDVIAGRSIVAVIKRTKKDEGTNKRAVFDHYSMETDDLPFGVDKISDILNTGKRTGVLKTGGGGWYYHDVFPGGKIRGSADATTFFEGNPGAINTIRDEVLKVLNVRNVTKPVFRTDPQEDSDG
jgi:hypothetical protein